MWTVEKKTDRLVVITISSPFGHDDLAPFQAAVGKLLTEVPGRVVTCMDLRHSVVLAPEVADALVGLMRRDNPRIERTAFLLNDNAVMGMQVARMIREANNPSRRTFHDSAQLIAWLEENLTPSELQILHQLLHV